MSSRPLTHLPRIQVHPGGHFLMTEEGRPFFWLADTAWEMFHRLRRDEARRYLSNRSQKGFNVIQAVVLAEHDGLRVPNENGDLPFYDADPTRPNEAYFAHVDELIRMAADYNLYVALLPTWGDKVSPIWGIGPAVFDEQNARSYGEWIGRRYAQDTNILWINGGDRPPVEGDQDWRPIWRALAEGIRSGVDGPCLMTFHTPGGIDRSTSVFFHEEAWLDLNTMQSGHGSGRDTPVWEGIARDWGLQPVKPVLDAEPNYEDHPVNPWPEWDPANGYYRDDDVRRQSYRSVFAGGCGVTYGHHAIWQFCGTRHEPHNLVDRYWWEALDRPGAADMVHLRRLVESRPYFERIPDDSLILSENGERELHLTGTRASDGSYAMVYVPDAVKTVTVDVGKVSGSQVQTWFYDTHTGLAQDAGRFEDKSSREFTMPLEWHDWVLVLDDVSKRFMAPGAN